MPYIIQITRWVLTAFFTSILTSRSVACYIAICILHTWLSVCLWQLTEKNLTEIFRCVKEASPILDPCTSIRITLNRKDRKDRNNFHQFVQKLGEKLKKNNRCCVLCVNTQMQRFTNIFEIIFILITFVNHLYFNNQNPFSVTF